MKHILFVIFLALLAATTGRFAASAGAGPPGRVWHVSLAPLPAVPADRQFRSIGKAAQVALPGDTVQIHSGTYRESVAVSVSGTPTRPIYFEAAPAAEVVISGADTLTDWRKEPGTDDIYSVAWPDSFLDDSPSHAHPDDFYHLLIGRAEQVLVENYALHQVLRRSQMSRGSFFADLHAKRLYAWSASSDDLTKVSVEASVRDVLWNCAGNYVHTRGLRFRYAANAAQQGAAIFTGRGDVVQHCVFERESGDGAVFLAPGQSVQSCTFLDNGELGLSANLAPGLRVTDCLIENNNTKGFERSWEAGGSKICFTHGAILDHCRILNNRGPGLWFDIGCAACEIKNCLIAGNEDAGLFYEISYGLYAHDNVIFGNGSADTPGAWGGQGGICLSSSPGCTVERNLIVGNKEGFDFREQERTTPRIGAQTGAKEVAVWNHDEIIRQNILADNQYAQVWGWFDVTDEREWPLAMQVKDAQEQPIPGLSLETLHIVFNGNLYDVPDGQGLFHWGAEWWRHRYYDSLAAVRRELNLEQGSLVSPLPFADTAARDYRLPPGSPAWRMNCCPHGTVPGVLLGVQQSIETSATGKDIDPND